MDCCAQLYCGRAGGLGGDAARPDLHNRQLEVGALWIVADDGAHFVIRPSCGIERGSMPAHTGPLGGLVHIEECANVRSRAARQVRGALPRQVHLIVLRIAGRLVGDHLMHCPCLMITEHQRDQKVLEHGNNVY